MRYDNGYGPIDRFCAKHPRFGISNLMLYLIIGQVVVFLLDLFFNGMASFLLFFSRELIFSGQVWRLVTFILVPSSSNPFYLALGCYVLFWTGRMLERQWGAAKFTLFYLCGMGITILFGLIVGYESIYYVNLSIFLILATMFGETQVLFFFVVPLKMKWLALIDVVLILVDMVRWIQAGAWLLALIPLASFVNYFIFTWPYWRRRFGAVRRRADPQVISFKKAQKQAQKAQQTQTWRHKCAVCGITDLDDPDMEFRYCSKCDGYYCYCANHINNHVHIHGD